MQHESDAGTVFALNDTDEFFQAIYSLDMDDGEVARVGDVDSFGLDLDSRFGLYAPSTIEWDGCNMWLAAISLGSGSDLYTVDMLTGIAEHVEKISVEGVDYGYLSSIEWDGQDLYGLVVRNLCNDGLIGTGPFPGHTGLYGDYRRAIWHSTPVISRMLVY